MPESNDAREKRLARKRERYQANREQIRDRARLGRQAKRQAKIAQRAAAMEVLEGAALDAASQLIRERLGARAEANQPQALESGGTKPAA